MPAESVKQAVAPDCHAIEAPPKTKKTNNTSGDTEKALSNASVDKEMLIKNGLLIKLPKVFQRSLAPFFDADMVYELASVVFKVKSAVDNSITLEDNEQDYYNAILSVINAYK